MNRRRLAAALLGMLMLTGCTSVPSDGPVVVVSQRAHTAEPHIDIRPVAPAADADQLAIVNGFLVAMADSGGDLSVAKQYLTPEAAASWRPDKGVQVYSAATNPHEADKTVTLDATALGGLDSRGSYTAHRAPLHHDFELIKVAGQWRISNPPDGLLLSSTLFATNYSPATLYFYDSAQATLVPDVIYLPKLRVTAPQLVRSLLAGPTSWLAPGVRTAVPAGLQLGVQGVITAANGNVSISFTRQLEQAQSDEARRLLAAQLLLTLRRNLPTVQGLSLSAETEPFALPDAVGGVWPATRIGGLDPLALRPIPDLFGIQDDRVVRIGETTGEPGIETLTGVFGRPGSGLDSVAVALDGSQVAVVAGDRTRLLVSTMSGQNPPQQLLDQPGLLSPRYSRSGELWAMSSDTAGTRVFVFAGEQPVPVTAPALAGVSVDEFRISPDGMRMIVSGRRDGAPVVGMVLLRRTDEGVVLDSWRPLDVAGEGTAPVTVQSLGWRSDTQLLLLGSDRETGAVFPYELDLDCQTVTRGNADIEGQTLSTMPYGRFAAVALTGDGYLVRRSDLSRWPGYETRSRLSAIAYPG